MPNCINMTPANTNAGTTIDLRDLPRIYLLDKEYKIVARDININQVLSLASALNRRNDQQQ